MMWPQEGHLRARFFDSSIRFFRPVATIVQPIAAVPTIDISCGSRAIPRYRQEAAELRTSEAVAWLGERRACGCAAKYVSRRRRSETCV